MNGFFLAKFLHFYDHMKDEGFHIHIGIDPVTGFVFGGNVREYDHSYNFHILILSIKLISFIISFLFQHDEDHIMHSNGTVERGWTKWEVMKMQNIPIVGFQPGMYISVLVDSLTHTSIVLFISNSLYEIIHP